MSVVADRHGWDGINLTLSVSLSASPCLSRFLSLNIASSALKSIFSLRERVCLICVCPCVLMCMCLVGGRGSCLCPPERVHGTLVKLPVH